MMTIRLRNSRLVLGFMLLMWTDGLMHHLWCKRIF